MARFSWVALGVLPVIGLVVACSHDDPPPAAPLTPAPNPTAPDGTNASPVGYGNQGYQQPNYAPAGQSSTPVTGQMSTPGPTALACQNDQQCMFHRCNMQFQKCAFPCASDNDCNPGYSCFVAGGPGAICMPKP